MTKINGNPEEETRQKEAKMGATSHPRALL